MAWKIVEQRGGRVNKRVNCVFFYDRCRSLRVPPPVWSLWTFTRQIDPRSPTLSQIRICSRHVLALLCAYSLLGLPAQGQARALASPPGAPSEHVRARVARPYNGSAIFSYCFLCMLHTFWLALPPKTCTLRAAAQTPRGKSCPDTGPASLPKGSCGHGNHHITWTYSQDS
jgi:hypothetical protein